MIELTRLNNMPVVVNSELIQCIEETPDTVITLTNGYKYVVKEKPADIIDKVVIFRRKISSPVNIDKS
jgi:flagellar protein FlbD